MSMIGQQIKKLRTEQGITQEQLGQMVGVTTQAVSKWERGGTPDAELLPVLADVLHVSIDVLFGREEQTIYTAIARRLSKMNSKEAYTFAFRICWMLEIGLFQNAAMVEYFLNTFTDPFSIADVNSDYAAKIMQDNGVAVMRLSQGLQHFFLMLEPENTIRDQLSDPAKLRKIFAVFSDEKLLRIIFYLYSRLNTPIDASLISRHTGLSIHEVNACMDILCQNKLATCTTIRTADGYLHSYLFHHESSVIPLLCFADELVRDNGNDFLFDFSRTKPLM